MRALIKIILITIGVLILAWQGVYWFAHLRGFTDSNLSTRLEKKYATYSDEKLLRLFKRSYIFFDENSYYELANRRDSRAVDNALKHLKSRSPYIRKVITRRLSDFDTPRIRDALMRIIDENKRDYEWRLALSELSELQDERAWNYVVELAKAPDRERNGSIAKLINFQKSESLEILKKCEIHMEPVIRQLVGSGINVIMIVPFKD